MSIKAIYIFDLDALTSGTARLPTSCESNRCLDFDDDREEGTRDEENAEYYLGSNRICPTVSVTTDVGCRYNP